MYVEAIYCGKLVMYDRQNLYIEENREGYQKAGSDKFEYQEEINHGK